MKVLFISDSCDFKKGKGVVSKSNLEILNEIFSPENVMIIALKGISRKNDFSKYNENEMVEFQEYKNKYQSLFNLLQLKHNHLSFSTEKKITKIIEKSELVFIDDSIFGRLSRICYNKNVKSICFFHNIRRNLAFKWLKYHGVKLLPSYISTLYNESLAAKYSSINIALNKRDAELYKHYYRRDIDYILPVQIREPECFSLVRKAIVYDLLFVGADYYPNIEGLRWFVKKVLPLVPHVNLAVAGFGMEKYIDEFSTIGNVHILGTVDNISDLYLSSKIVILPIFDGGGMKVKTAEALMHGNYLIGTRESLIGYEETDDIFICDDEFSFKNNILDVLKNNNKNWFSVLNRNLYIKNHNFKYKSSEIEELMVNENIIF